MADTRPTYGTEQLAPVVKPGSVVVVGVSSNPDGFGARTIRILLDSSFRGEITAVNPKYEELHGVRCVPTVKEAPSAPDCVIVAVPSQDVVSVLEEAALHGARGAVVYSSGFGETDAWGAEQERKIAQLSRRSGMRVLGPNTAGLFNYVDGIVLSFVQDVDLTLPVGPIAVVSQSAGLGMLFTHARHRGIGFSHCLTCGNASDINVIDLVNYLVEDPSTSVITLIFEGVSDGRALVEVGKRARKAGKPIIAMVTGKTVQGRKAALSHTGTLAGRAEVTSAALRTAGIVEVDTPELMLELAQLFANATYTGGTGVGVFTSSGGASVIAADAAEHFNVPLPAPSDATSKALLDISPAAIISNPADLTANISRTPAAYAEALAAYSRDDGFAAIVTPLTSTGGPSTAARPASFVEAASRIDKPVCAVWLSSWKDDPGTDVLDADRSVTLFRSMHHCFAALRHWLDWHCEQPDRGDRTPLSPRGAAAIEATIASALAKDGGAEPVTLSEHESANLLAKAGIPVVPHTLVESVDAAVEAAQAFGFPVVLKGTALGVAHKSDAGGVRLDLRTLEQVRDAFYDLVTWRPTAGAEASGSVLVAPMVAGGVEMIVGATRDEHFGPVVSVGMGGIFVEALNDIEHALAPVSPDEAALLIGRLRTRRMFEAQRGKEPLNVDALARTVAMLSELMVAVPDIAEVDLNPVLLRPEGSPSYALDALVVLTPRNSPGDVIP